MRILGMPFFVYNEAIFGLFFIIVCLDLEEIFAQIFLWNSVCCLKIEKNFAKR